MTCVNGRRRVPWPPARMTPLIITVLTYYFFFLDSISQYLNDLMCWLNTFSFRMDRLTQRWLFLYHNTVFGKYVFSLRFALQPSFLSFDASSAYRSSCPGRSVICVMSDVGLPRVLRMDLATSMLVSSS